MANHKRRKPKSARSGCLGCKPHKHQGRKSLNVIKPCKKSVEELKNVSKKMKTLNEKIREAIEKGKIMWS